MIKQAYKDILDRLTEEVPALRFIDLDRGQYEQPENNYIPVFPACLIRFEEIPWGDIGDYILHGDARITLRTAFPIYNDINNLTPEEIREAGLAELDILGSINLAMHGYSGVAISKMQHINTVQENNGHAVIFNDTFACTILDTSARDKHYTEDTISLNVLADKA